MTINDDLAHLQLLTVPEVAKILGIRTSRVYELARLGLLPYVKMGRQIRFSLAALEKWIENGGCDAP